MERKFNIGDKVKVIGSRDDETWFRGKIGTVYDLGSSSNVVLVNFKNRPTHPYNDVGKNGHQFITNELENLGKGKVKKDSMVRYMVYGCGCNNKGNLLIHESDMKTKLKECAYDDAWTGDIIGYKLTPLYQAQKRTSVRISKFKK